MECNPLNSVDFFCNFSDDNSFLIEIDRITHRILLLRTNNLILSLSDKNQIKLEEAIDFNKNFNLYLSQIIKKIPFSSKHNYIKYFYFSLLEDLNKFKDILLFFNQFSSKKLLSQPSLFLLFFSSLSPDHYIYDNENSRNLYQYIISMQIFFIFLLNCISSKH